MCYVLDYFYSNYQERFIVFIIQIKKDQIAEKMSEVGI